MADRPLATPLAGIKVLEFSYTVMGPTAGLIFAEFGADVVKIEPAPNVNQLPVKNRGTVETADKRGRWK